MEREELEGCVGDNYLFNIYILFSHPPSNSAALCIYSAALRVKTSIKRASATDHPRRWQMGSMIRAARLSVSIDTIKMHCQTLSPDQPKVLALSRPATMKMIMRSAEKPKKRIAASGWARRRRPRVGSATSPMSVTDPKAGISTAVSGSMRPEDAPTILIVRTVATGMKTTRWIARRTHPRMFRGLRGPPPDPPDWVEPPHPCCDRAGGAEGLTTLAGRGAAGAVPVALVT